ncbi:MAG: thiamine-phosphate kinase [Dehalococcoidales bacterium]|nr:thiamine-phosphate kinase [Dehalococcoidales bacterium]
MKVTELGQFGMIDAVARLIESSRDNSLPSWRNLVAGIGDDCAVWRGDTDNQLAKVDCQVQGVHFNLDIISWEDLGWKALAVNLSDIASMGGVPRYALVSLGLPLDTEVEDVFSLYKGMLTLARLSGTAVVGGNMSSSPVVFVDINVIGSTANREGKYLTRGSARVGDRIAVTGWLGTAAAGLEMLSRKISLNALTNICLKQAFSRPEPRLKEGRLLLGKGVETAIDISDGLISDLGHICNASAVGAVIELPLLPIRPEVISVFGEQAVEMALSGGEDYQLLFTAPLEVIEEVRQDSPYPVTAIGEIVAGKVGQIVLVDAEGRHLAPDKTGWDHFRRR